MLCKTPHQLSFQFWEEGRLWGWEGEAEGAEGPLSLSFPIYDAHFFPALKLRKPQLS